MLDSVFCAVLMCWSTIFLEHTRGHWLATHTDKRSTILAAECGLLLHVERNSA